MSCNTQSAECCAADESNNASKKQDSCCSSSRGCNSTSDLLSEDDGWNIYRRTLPKNIVLDLLKREAELWHDPEFQKKLGVKYDATYHTDTILDQQRRVLKEFGVKDLEVGLEALHGLRAIYRDDVELIKKMKEIAIYMKYDITRPGDLWKGDQVPDMDLSTLDGGRIKLYDYMTKDRPLVLIGGSYSWPPMRYGVPNHHDGFEKHKDIATFLTVYIREAHANDEWPLGDKFSWRQHRTLEERTELAKLFKQDMQYQLPMYVDLMDNTFERVFAAWPERYYIVLNGKVMYKSMPRDESMHFDEVVAWLDEFRKTGVTSA